MRITVTLLATVMLLTTPNIAVAAVTVTLTATIIIAAIGTAIAIIGSVVVCWSFSRLPPVPICKKLTLVRSKKQGDDWICVYVYEKKRYEVMLSGIQGEHPDIKGCPDSVHPKA